MCPRFPFSPPPKAVSRQTQFDRSEAMPVNDPTPERAGAYGASYKPVVVQPVFWTTAGRWGKEEPLPRSWHPAMPPQLLALPFVVKRWFGVLSSATSMTSLGHIGERSGPGMPAWTRHQPLTGSRHREGGNICQCLYLLVTSSH